MDFSFIFFAFVCGLAFKLCKLPPLIGFLCAGFLLNIMGYHHSDTLTQIADFGITLMLFTIGLKLNLKDLFKLEVIGTSLTHTSLWIGAVSGMLLLLGTALSTFSGMTGETLALIGFALSFSSTVCVVKVLEESGESKTRHGKLAISILVIQDIVAVAYLVVATGKVPSIYAWGLLALIPLIPLFHRMVNLSGHGELLPLTGLMLAMGGYHLFEAVNIKGDLGALIAGLLIAPHLKASELAKSLLNFKDIFLIGFFLSIGLTALPTLEDIYIALVLVALIPIKAMLFFGLMYKLKLRARTSFLSSLILSNYSEFGLIVCALAVSLGALHESWLVVMAIAVSLSFVITSVIYTKSHTLYTKYKTVLKHYESERRLPQDVYPSIDNAEFLVVGMGRVGIGAHNALTQASAGNVWGMDADQRKVARLQKKGYKAFIGDGEDIDLWENLNISSVQLVLLALPSIEDAANITNQLNAAGYQGKIAAIARYEDEVEHLLQSGVDKVFNFFTEAGQGFAEESLQFVHSN